MEIIAFRGLRFQNLLTTVKCYGYFWRGATSRGSLLNTMGPVIKLSLLSGSLCWYDWKRSFEFFIFSSQKYRLLYACLPSKRVCRFNGFYSVKWSFGAKEFIFPW